MPQPHKNRMPEPTSPGELLEEEWLKPLRMTQSALAAKMGVHVQVVNGIVRERRAVTAHTALLLGRALKTSPEFWMNAQNAIDLWEARKHLVDAEASGDADAREARVKGLPRAKNGDARRRRKAF